MRVTLKAFVLLWLGVPIAQAEDEFEKPPITYSRSAPGNAVSQLQARLQRGEVNLPFDGERGYLPALLQALGVPRESQMLVFSKTSMQRARIAPQTPRAIYFNDQVYVGYCQEGDVLEISAADPTLGAVFFSLRQTKAVAPILARQTHQCLQCHSASQSGDVPSHLVRSVFTDADGLPILSEGGFRVDHATPLENRWGGWYVTGTHGRQAHLGNLIVRDLPVSRPVQNSEGSNVHDLSDRLSIANYLTPHSDIVALMVFEHQTLVHNLITQANFTTRQALHHEAELNRELGDSADHRWESTTGRIENAGEKLVKGLLFVAEAPLIAPISGSSGFAQIFSQPGPRDSKGRSLRELDLNKRMFKYPCSYLIYSAAYDGLPREMKVYVAGRLRQILRGDDTAGRSAKRLDDTKHFAHLSVDDRLAIYEILSQTKPEVLKP
jgi:hypothetical protein